MRPDSGRGMTVIDMVVVVAVTGVLLAIVVPAVQAARAAARAANCVNNLKQIGLALHNYHSANGVLPMSQTCALTYKEGHTYGNTVFTALLPYMEQVAAYNAYNFHLENWHVTNETVTRMQIETFLCPDNPDTESTPASEIRYPESRSTFAKAHYGANWGGGRGPWGEEFAKEKGTYLGVMMTVIAPDGLVKAADGKPRARNVSFAEITDGTSYTLAIVEKRDSFGWAVGGWGGSEFDVYKTPAYEGDDKLSRKVYTGSTHENGPNALLCDGSVRNLPARQDKKIWYRLITRAGGEAVRFND
jgi:prepilin-type processing-associated H-X9-DG protein